VAVAGQRRVDERAVGAEDAGDERVAPGPVRLAVGVEVGVDERVVVSMPVSVPEIPARSDDLRGKGGRPDRLERWRPR